MLPTRLEQTLTALARPPIAVAHPIQIHIPIAVAPIAATPTGHLRLPEVIVRAQLTARARIPLAAVAHHLLGVRIPLAVVRVRMVRRHRPGAVARPAADDAVQRRITVVALHAAVAVRAGRKAAALVALAGARIARGRVPVAVALLAIVEVPETRLALVAHAAVRVRPAAALAGDLVAVAVEGARLVAVALFAALRAEAVGAGRAPVAAAADDVRFALARAAVGVAFFR